MPSYLKLACYLSTKQSTLTNLVIKETFKILIWNWSCLSKIYERQYCHPKLLFPVCHVESAPLSDETSHLIVERDDEKNRIYFHNILFNSGNLDNKRWIFLALFFKLINNILNNEISIIIRKNNEYELHRLVDQDLAKKKWFQYFQIISLYKIYFAFFSMKRV